MQEREVTERIRIDQLQPLLETTSERITSPMPAVKLEELLQPEPTPPLAVSVTFRRTPRGTAVPEFVDLQPSAELCEFEVEDAPLPERATLGTINGVPLHGYGPARDGIDGVIDAAVDAAIEAEIYNTEIEVAIDAVTLPVPDSAHQPRYLAVALGVAAALFTGIGLMLAF